MSCISSLFVRLATALFLLFHVACDPPPPKVPVRELPPPATWLLAQAPSAYGLPTPIALPDDQGSASAQAAFVSMAGGTAVHEPALDLVAAVVGKTFAEAQELPADALLQWLYWKCGAVSVPGPVNVFVAPPGAEAYFQEHLRRLAAAVPKSGATFSFGVARISVMDYVAQAVVLGVRPVDVAPIAKSVAPGAKVPLRIALKKAYADLTLYVDQGGPAVLALPMKQEADGTFGSEVPLPPAPGRYFVEIVGIDVPPDGDIQKGWRTSLLWLPLHAGVAEPAAPDGYIRRPRKNHPDPSTWSSEIFNAFNDERVRLGRAPLSFEQQASRLAQQRSDELAGLSTMPTPDYGLYRKLADAGAPARNLFSYVDHIEFVSEYITLRLLRPAVRYALFDPAMTTFALGLSQRRVAPGQGLFNSVEYVFEQIRIDPPKERDRILGELDADERAAGGSAFARSDPLSTAAQGIVDEVCRGGPKPTDARKVFARAVGLDPSLRRRTAVPWMGYDLSKAQIAGIHEKVKNEKYTHVGAGVCQGTVDGHRGAVLVMVLFAGP
jgi:hypothetical protein